MIGRTGATTLLQGLTSVSRHTVPLPRGAQRVSGVFKHTQKGAVGEEASKITGACKGGSKEGSSDDRIHAIVGKAISVVYAGSLMLTGWILVFGEPRKKD